MRYQRMHGDGLVERDEIFTNVALQAGPTPHRISIQCKPAGDFITTLLVLDMRPEETLRLMKQLMVALEAELPELPPTPEEDAIEDDDSGSGANRPWVPQAPADSPTPAFNLFPLGKELRVIFEDGVRDEEPLYENIGAELKKAGLVMYDKATPMMLASVRSAVKEHLLGLARRGELKRGPAGVWHFHQGRWCVATTVCKVQRAQMALVNGRWQCQSCGAIEERP